MNSGDGFVRIGAVSKLGVLEAGSCCSLGEARRLTVFGRPNKLIRSPQTSGR